MYLSSSYAFQNEVWRSLNACFVVLTIIKVLTVISWQPARQQNTEAAYQAYLDGQTLKRPADEAKLRLIEKAQAEDEKAWQPARQQNTKAAYQAYLDGQTLKRHA